MLIWCVPTLFFAGIVFLLDFIVRRKKWNENSKEEKKGLLLTLLVSFPYIFCSIYGWLLGIVGPRGSSPFMVLLHEAALAAGTGTVFVCIAATLASLILRKRGNAVASNRALLMGLFYCAAMTALGFAS